MTLPNSSKSKLKFKFSLNQPSRLLAVTSLLTALVMPQTAQVALAQRQVMRPAASGEGYEAWRDITPREEWSTEPGVPTPEQRRPLEILPAATSNPYGPSQFSGSSNLLAFLKMIRYAEGTSNGEGYQIMFTSRRFYNFVDHPRRMNCSMFRGRQLCSTAAGAYQFLDTTWDRVARSIGATDFGPGWQDRAATELIRRSGALADIEAGNIERAIAKTAGIWASFPRWHGDSRGQYNQAVKPMSELLRVFYRYQQMYLATR